MTGMATPLSKHQKKGDPLPDALPDNMKDAILAFILTCAIRRIRGQVTKHNSMLIHVMLFVNWIDRTAWLVNEQVNVYKNEIAGKDAQLLARLKKLFEEDFRPTTADVLENLAYTDLRIKEHEWTEVLTELDNAASKIEVRAVHGTKSVSGLEYHNIREIDYDEYKETGLSVIAVGGSRLARGITLEGLSVSYYLRASKMYDTLMQMGRWFGYRPGYADLVRIYTTDTLVSWFNHIAMATEDMRNDFDELASLPRTRPSDYQLKVQNHPGLLAITAATKLFWAETLTVSFSGQNPQTYQLLKDESAVSTNYKAYTKLLFTASQTGQEEQRKLISGKVSHLLYRNVDVEMICTFLDEYQISQPSIKNATLSNYIRTQARQKNIKGWNLVFRSNTDEKVFINRTGLPTKQREPNEITMSYTFENGGKTIGATVRNQLQGRESSVYYISKNQIDDIKDRSVDLNRNFPSNKDIKEARANEGIGLLLIYLLDPRGTSGPASKLPYVGFSIHFPRIASEQPVSYTATPAQDTDDTQDDDDLREGDE